MPAYYDDGRDRRMGAVTTQRRSYRSAIWRTWMGDTTRLDRNSVAELIWATMMVWLGVSFLLWPDAVFQMHAFGLFVWKCPPWLIGYVFIVMGLLSVAGIGLFFYQGRCHWSRVLRFAGATLGVYVWLNVLGSLLYEGSYIYLPMYTGIFLTYLRTLHVAHRRF